jgi:hypothetical protein
VVGWCGGIIYEHLKAMGFQMRRLFVPICWAGWAAGRKAGLFLATACAVFFGVADLMAGHTYKHPMIPLWNALMLLALYAMAVHILAAWLSAYRSIREGESRFRALFTQSLLGVAQVRTATVRLVRVNDRLCAILGHLPKPCPPATLTSVVQECLQPVQG